MNKKHKSYNNKTFFSQILTITHFKKLQGMYVLMSWILTPPVQFGRSPKTCENRFTLE